MTIKHSDLSNEKLNVSEIQGEVGECSSKQRIEVEKTDEVIMNSIVVSVDSVATTIKSNQSFSRVKISPSGIETFLAPIEALEPQNTTISIDGNKLAEVVTMLKTKKCSASTEQ